MHSQCLYSELFLKLLFEVCACVFHDLCLCSQTIPPPGCTPMKEWHERTLITRLMLTCTSLCATPRISVRVCWELTTLIRYQRYTFRFIEYGSSLPWRRQTDRLATVYWIAQEQNASSIGGASEEFFDNFGYYSGTFGSSFLSKYEFVCCIFKSLKISPANSYALFQNSKSCFEKRIVPCTTYIPAGVSSLARCSNVCSYVRIGFCGGLLGAKTIGAKRFSVVAIDTEFEHGDCFS